MAAATFLTSELNPPDGGNFLLQVAWGADPTSDAAGWSWSDITGDVMQADGERVRATHGRADEASTTQPAQFSVMLNNTLGRYSEHALSPNWPNVKLGVPVRALIDTDSNDAYFVMFQGYADTWTPSFDVTGRRAVVMLHASGVLRRLAQGTNPVISSLRRAMQSFDDLIAYWPCEDGSNAKSYTSALEGDIPMSIVGEARSSSNTDFDCSAPLPVLNASAWTGTITPGYTSTGELLIRLLASWPSGGDTVEDGRVILRVLCTGTVRQWDIYYRTVDGAIGIAGYSASGAEVVNSGFIQFVVNGKRLRMEMSLTQDGGAVDWQIATLGVEAGFASFFGGTEGSSTLGRITNVIINPDGNFNNVAVGHVSVQTQTGDLFAANEELNAYLAENAVTRMTRLCAENNIPLSVFGSSTVEMSVQTPKPLLALLRECEAADSGLLLDGVSAGLRYYTHTQIENEAAMLTVDAAAGEASDLEPVSDDQRTVNRAYATRERGSTAFFEDTDGPRGTTKIGIYESSATVSIRDDTLVRDYAAWLVHRGTIQGYRYPSLKLICARDPGLAQQLSQLRPSNRVDITGISDVRTQLPAGTYQAVVEGVTQTLWKRGYDVVLNLSPFEPWRTALAVQDSGSTSDVAFRGRPDASELDSAALAGATSLSVATAVGPLWITSAADADSFPLFIEVGGLRVQVTAITGSSSPQTFTVTGADVTKALTDGLTVDLWRPPGLGL